MKKILHVMIVMAILTVPGMMANGSLFQSEDHIRAEVRGSKFANPGDTVRLFYGMDKSVKDVFCVNSIVPVYRVPVYSTEAYPSPRPEVGKIKITKNLHGRFVEGVVVEGKLMADDLAMEATSECQIKSPSPQS